MKINSCTFNLQKYWNIWKGNNEVYIVKICMGKFHNFLEKYMYSFIYFKKHTSTDTVKNWFRRTIFLKKLEGLHNINRKESKVLPVSL